VRRLDWTGTATLATLSSWAGSTSHFPLFSPVLLAKDGQLHVERCTGKEHCFCVCHDQLLLNECANPSVYCTANCAWVCAPGYSCGVLLCLPGVLQCLRILLFLPWRVGSLVARDCLWNLTLVCRASNGSRNCCCWVAPCAIPVPLSVLMNWENIPVCYTALRYCRTTLIGVRLLEPDNLATVGVNSNIDLDSILWKLIVAVETPKEVRTWCCVVLAAYFAASRQSSSYSIGIKQMECSDDVFPTSFEAKLLA